MRHAIALLVFSFITLGIYSQDNRSNHKNEIGFVVTDLIDGAIQFRYERLVSKHFSVNLGIGYKGEEGIVNLSGLDTEKIKTSNITYSGIKVTPDIRYYLNNVQQTGMNGFYMGAYVKYSGFKSDLSGQYINDTGITYDLEFDSKINVTSIGFMVGYKLPITKRFALDFLIAGPGSGFYNFTIENKKDLPDEFYDDLNEALEEYSLFDLLDGDFRFSQIKRKSDLKLFSFRYGITATYSF
ncbi:DUF3575 domain-containing protein [Tamlana agarivorans]|uniref:DUF3575 domain-containing protein n=1 Tax=Pseudotamlana agarivorans TaxID=481183 RepID=A0ACC5UC77_9FLAO|nr:DUF3575 domain-containing protein [Tamlana agarivorans]MBU2951871.1 DUF3575 domain-containing protein [Tamlana agarivorans]